MDPRKRNVELEAVSTWLKEENRSLVARVDVRKQIENLKGEVMALRDKEQMWDKAEEKCSDLESENTALRTTLEEKDVRITTLVTENERISQQQRKQEEELKQVQGWVAKTMPQVREWLKLLERVNAEKKAEVIKLEKEITRQKKQVSDEKMATKANEKKVTQLVQRNKVLEKENFALKAKKEEGDKKILELGHRFDVLDKEKQRLHEELMQRIDVIKVLVQEKECMDAKLQQLKTVINNLTVNVKLEDNADLPHNDLCLSGNPSQSQGKQSAKRTRPDT